jgi:hypothetical protein
MCRWEALQSGEQVFNATITLNLAPVFIASGEQVFAITFSGGEQPDWFKYPLTTVFLDCRFETRDRRRRR